MSIISQTIAEDNKLLDEDSIRKEARITKIFRPKFLDVSTSHANLRALATMRGRLVHFPPKNSVIKKVLLRRSGVSIEGLYLIILLRVNCA